MQRRIVQIAVGQRQSGFKEDGVDGIVAGLVPEFFITSVAARMMHAGQVQHFMALQPPDHVLRQHVYVRRIVGKNFAVRPGGPAAAVFTQFQTERQIGEKGMIQHQVAPGLDHLDACRIVAHYIKTSRLSRAQSPKAWVSTMEGCTATALRISSTPNSAGKRLASCTNSPMTSSLARRAMDSHSA